MNKRIIAGCIAAAVAAILAATLVVAWIKGGTQPTAWIEVPVASPGGAQ